MRKILILLAVFIALAQFSSAQSGEWKPTIQWKRSGRLEARRPGRKPSQDGLIKTHGGMGLLYWAGGQIGNCMIRVVFKMRDENDNSGVFIRIPSSRAKPGCR